ncbi:MULTISPECIES: Sec-independent protein translocase subunit TatA [unclassified Streptomyces]|uniref:Sec-independent protein translocase subunit TatA n=1 Tax=unclassified Streptomyces TaxID=2593676 RepID=UPI0029665608|nr:Sec-independent protein translocase subunit TatA [Streptomyces sp. SJL17-1]
MFGISELAILLIVVILIFGAKKLPELARSMGKSARILKSEARAMKDEQEPASAAVDDAPATEPVVPRVIRAAPGDVTSHREPRSGHTTPGA